MRAYATCTASKYLVQVMQSQMIGLQSSLDRILNVIQTQTQVQPQTAPHTPFPPAPQFPQNMPPPPARDMHGVYFPSNGIPRGSVDLFNPQGPQETVPRPPTKAFPPLPGFAPPVSTMKYNPLSYYMLNFLHSPTNMRLTV